MEELYKLLEESLNERLYQLSVGGPRNKDGDIRLKLRPVMIKTEIYFQLESFRGNQVFHENLTAGGKSGKSFGFLFPSDGRGDYGLPGGGSGQQKRKDYH